MLKEEDSKAYNTYITAVSEAIDEGINRVLTDNVARPEYTPEFQGLLKSTKSDLKDIMKFIIANQAPDRSSMYHTLKGFDVMGDVVRWLDGVILIHKPLLSFHHQIIANSPSLVNHAGVNTLGTIASMYVDTVEHFNGYTGDSGKALAEKIEKHPYLLTLLLIESILIKRVL